MKHPRALSPATIKSAIDNAGYDIMSTPVDSRPPPSWSDSLVRLSSLATMKRRRHLDNCAQCRSELAPRKEVPGETALEKVRYLFCLDDYPTHRKAVQDSLNGSTEEKYRSENTHEQCEPRHDSPAVAVPSRVTLSVGGMTCASCSNAITHALSELPGVSDVAVNLLGNSATLAVSSTEIVPAVVSAIEDIGYEAEVVHIEPAQAVPAPKKPTDTQKGGPQRVQLSIDGMTCAACSNTVTGLLSDIPGVSEVVVNLLGKSATAVIADPDLAPQLVEAINDAGYEAEIVNMQPLVDNYEQDNTGPRTVSLRVEGMFCP